MLAPHPDFEKERWSSHRPPFLVHFILLLVEFELSELHNAGAMVITDF